MKLATILLLLIIHFIPEKIFSCSAFTYTKDGHIILAANTDACKKVDGLIIVNKRNLSKQGSYSSTLGQFASWISEYGSITYTYCCREIAQYGMNEAGLVISTVGLPGSESPEADERPPLDGNIWAQYLLDNCSSIEEVLKVEHDINIVNSQDQYLICDRKGHSLVVECLDGKMIYYFDDSLPIPILTNEKYEECLSNSNQNYIPQKDPNISNRRFQAGKNMLSNSASLNDDQVIKFSFDVLDKMSQHPCTQWNLVFDIRKLTIYFRTKQTPDIRYINLSEVDFSCETQMKELDVNVNFSGNVNERFTEYSRTNNLNLMRKSFMTFGIKRTEKQLIQIIDFFDSFKCAK